MDVTRSYSGLVACKAVLTFLRISCNFDGVTNVLGKQPFAKILIADAYFYSWVINILYSITCLSSIVLKYKREFIEQWCRPKECVYRDLIAR